MDAADAEEADRPAAECLARREVRGHLRADGRPDLVSDWNAGLNVLQYEG